ncbi:MAG: transglutaminase family protein, partial [Acidimicrobiia bacterium]
MTRYRVTHRTTYQYEEEVSASYGQMHLLPRAADGQTCRATRVVIDPAPDDLRERTDFFGNRAAFFAIHSEHNRLTVTTTSDVSVDRRDGLGLLGSQPWEQVRDRTALPGEDGWEPTDFLLDSPLVAASPALADYAGPSFTAGRPVLEALLDLGRRIHADFVYEPGSTSVTTSVDEVLTARNGVCQDFAHLAIGCLRSLGLAARYVSGYV